MKRLARSEPIVVVPVVVEPVPVQVEPVAVRVAEKMPFVVPNTAFGILRRLNLMPRLERVDKWHGV
mgnify:CR=1 FL=1